MARIGTLAMPVEQLDFETGEKIDDYESIEDAALDNYIQPGHLRKALKHNNGILRNKKLRFIYKGH